MYALIDFLGIKRVYQGKNNDLVSKSMLNEGKFLKLIETVFEAAPSAILQLWILG